MSTIKPVLDYLLCEEVKKVSGAVTPGAVDDHWQKYKVLAVGQGRYNEYQNIWVEQDIRVGDVIYVQKHAEADTPDELRQKSQYLIMASRVMAVEGK